jgi:peptidoglycan hydrolase-like protein with peptidoglycan-binding domain
MNTKAIFAGLVVAILSFGAYAGQGQAQEQEQNPASSQQQMQIRNLSANTSVVRQVQQKLKDQGYTVGQIDGKWGPKTKDALSQFQQAQGLEATGDIDMDTLAALGFSSSDIAAFERQQQEQQQQQQQPQSGQPGSQQQMQEGQGQGSGNM